MSKFPITERTCACGTKFLGKGRAKWCSTRCRRDTLYGRPCLDCGARVSGNNGNGPNAPVRCVQCGNVHAGAKRKVWTREACLDALRVWAAEYGEPPAILDWNPTAARDRRDDERAARAQTGIRAGFWPHANAVIRAFGSWSAGIEAAGFQARPSGGGGGNHLRRRDKAAA